jgi:hypothetical protein
MLGRCLRLEITLHVIADVVTGLSCVVGEINLYVI